jgi:hypothetical protein
LFNRRKHFLRTATFVPFGSKPLNTNPKFYTVKSQPCFPELLAHALLLRASKRSSNQLHDCQKNEKGCGYERIFTPGIGRHLSHNLISAQIQTAKQQQWRTDAAVVRFDRKETRLTFPSGLTQGHRDIIRVDRPRKLQLPSILNPVLSFLASFLI